MTAVAISSRLITPHDREVAQRLKSIYFRKKNALGLTQEALSKKTGFKQSTISCHMNGHIALRGLKGVIAYADALEVSPEEIDPRYKARFVQPIDDIPPIEVFTLTGQKIDIVPRTSDRGSRSMKGFIVGTEYLPVFMEDTLVITDQDEPLYENKRVMLKVNGEFFFARLVEISQRSLTYDMPLSMTAARDQRIRTGASKEEIAKKFPPSPVKVPLNEVEQILPVVVIELP